MLRDHGDMTRDINDETRRLSAVYYYYYYYYYYYQTLQQHNKQKVNTGNGLIEAN